MKLKDSLGNDLISRLATPSNIRLGEEIFKSGGVEILSCDDNKATAKVSGGQTKMTEIEGTEDMTMWKCSCLGKRTTIFCKHCVALAIAFVETDISSTDPPVE
ncbi:SWIM zinc finger family protein [Youngiibacter multivorans]|uniref:Zn finger protein n=1 Tax=Youngiibacter multivorans TaxID=937251 RepID=A0ABS4G6C7_9CLOT|nr:hypothetical protein [Youngiibacter multivorans]MBP1919835.1 putative Zn finger protein [Youngiibacter multivorans]